jgi:heterodisulfide reductase subunit D
MKLNELKKEIEVCAYCPLMCKNMCCFHSAAKNEASAPTMKNLLLDWSQKKKIELKDISEIMYQCTLCGQCTQWCEEKRDIPNNMIAARCEVVDINSAPKEVVEFDQHSIRQHNPYGEDHEKRNKGMPSGTIDKNDTDTFLFVGCTTAYYQNNILEAFHKITSAAGVNVGVLGQDEWCCGLPQYKLGLKQSAVELAQHNVKALQDVDCKTLLFVCPTCFSAFNDFYSEWGIDFKFEVKFITEYILELLNSSKIALKKNIEETVTYHDPCDLVRPIKSRADDRIQADTAVEQPRDLLNKIPGIDFVEMRWNGEKAFCCGGDVATKSTYPKVSEEIGNKVLEEALKVKAKYLVTACPSCNQQFGDVCKNNGRETDLKILSLCEFVAAAI